MGDHRTSNMGEGEFKVEPTVPQYDELKLMSHWICCNCSLWLPEDKTKLLACADWGVCCCCSGSMEAKCQFSELDRCCSFRGDNWCISLNKCKADGCKDSIWGYGGMEAVCCFICFGASAGACHFPHFETCASDSNGVCKCYSGFCCIVETCACWWTRTSHLSARAVTSSSRRMKARTRTSRSSCPVWRPSQAVMPLLLLLEPRSKCQQRLLYNILTNTR